jgi:hypothetical protein
MDSRNPDKGYRAIVHRVNIARRARKLDCGKFCAKQGVSAKNRCLSG